MPSARINYRHPTTTQPRSPQGARHAFTLVEMLVATAVTLILLVLFAQMFQAATSTILQQRGMAQNDARARMIASILRKDLQNGTFRDSDVAGTSKGLVPYNPQETDPSQLLAQQRGYVYISENDTADDTDDVLQFTASMLPADVGYRNRNNSADQYPYVGIASPIGRPDGSGFNANDRNQPVFDDGHAENSGSAESSQSRAAEITYFVRNGTLYRRVMLLRDPLPASIDYTADPTMGVNGTGGDLLPGAYDATADITGTVDGDFWNDFDLAAFFDGAQTRFSGITSLDNTQLAGELLSQPQHRFGFRYVDGRPREYVNGRYIGRFTMEETSHQDFSWPARNDGTNPFERSDLALGSLGSVTQYANGTRRGEDILLHNVDAFDIKVFDPARYVYDSSASMWVHSPGYVDLGYDGTGAFSHLSSRVYGREDFGPRFYDPGADGLPGEAGVDDDDDGTADNPSERGFPDTDDIRSRVFDTWHPTAFSPDTTNDAYREPPFRPLYHRFGTGEDYRSQQSQSAFFPQAGVDAEAGNDPRTGVASPLFPDWDDNENYSNLRPGDTGYNSSTAQDERRRIFPVENGGVQYTGIYYEIQPGTSGTSGATKPIFPWPPDFTTTVSDGSITWVPRDNRIGITSVQLTVRFRDVGSNLPRQLTIIHSFSD